MTDVTDDMTGQADALLAEARQRLRDGDATAAAMLCEQVLVQQNDHAHAHHLLGLIELQLDRPAALVHLASAVRAAPAEAAFWLDYIDGLIRRSEFDAARQVIAFGRERGLAGDAVEALAARLGRADDSVTASVLALLVQGRSGDALAAAQALTAQYPADAFGWKIIAGVHRERGKLEDAVAAMQRALACKPDDAESLMNLGGLYNELDRTSEAVVQLQATVALDDTNAAAWASLGSALVKRPAEAEHAFRRSLALDPNAPEVLNNFALHLHNHGRLDEAMASYRKALQLQPAFHLVRSNMLFCLSQMRTCSAAALFAEHRAFGRQVEAALRASRPTAKARRHRADPAQALRPIRVGLLSGDLRNHAVASFIEPVLARLAGRSRLSVIAYYNHPRRDEVSARLQAYMANWRDIHGDSDAQVAERMRADGIDVLIDLSGHTAFNRLPLLARKPAPVQVSWIGYPGTTGMDAVDYYLADRMMLPPGRFDAQFSERLALLPLGAPFQIAPQAPAVSALPALGNGCITFGSFNRLSKLSREVLALWARLLRALPNARMVIGAMPEDGTVEPLAGWLADEGIDSGRVAMHARTDLAAYLALLQQVDICLDSFPYSGGTTTWHSLTMGVPTLTLAGDTPPGRQSACILEHSGLDAFVAADDDEFVAKGLAACADLDKLAALRAGLRDTFPPLSDDHYGEVADSIESALRTMWQRWCSGAAAAAFMVPPGSGGASLDELAARPSGVPR